MGEGTRDKAFTGSTFWAPLNTNNWSDLAGDEGGEAWGVWAREAGKGREMGGGVGQGGGQGGVDGGSNKAFTDSTFWAPLKT